MIVLLAAMVGALTVFVAVGALTGQFSTVGRRVAVRAGSLQRGLPEITDANVNVLRDDSLAGSSALSRMLRRYAWTTLRARLLEQGEIPLRVSEYVLGMLLLFAAVTALVTLISGLLLGGLAIAIGVVVTVEAWVRSRATRRLQQFEKQLPLALQLMATSLKSGFGIMEACQTVTRELDAPISTEFQRVIDDARLGAPFERGLEAMTERVASKDLRIVVRALDIHRKVGGNLAAILEQVASTLRQREELRGHVRALTAQQRLGGIIVGLLPIWVVGFFLVADPDFIAPLWRETAGRIMAVIGITMEVVAFFAMRKVLEIEV